MKVVNGWAFPDADTFMVTEMKPDGSYQRGHLERAMTYVTDWSCAIDGGAHVGTWTRLLLQRFTHVVAVEPSPDTCEALRWNLREHCTVLLTDPARVTVHQAALGAIPGRVDLTMDPSAVVLQNTGARYVCPGDTIPRLTIDSWSLPTLGFLKLDIEGAEVDALTGATATLTRCRPIVLYEDKGFWKRFGYPRDAPARLLEGLGYQRLERAGQDAIWGPR